MTVELLKGARNKLRQVRTPLFEDLHSLSTAID